MTAFKEKKKSTQNVAVSYSESKTSTMDVYTAGMPDNMEAVKQHISARFNIFSVISIHHVPTNSFFL